MLKPPIGTVGPGAYNPEWEWFWSKGLWAAPFLGTDAELVSGDALGASSGGVPSVVGTLGYAKQFTGSQYHLLANRDVGLSLAGIAVTTVFRFTGTGMEGLWGVLNDGFTTCFRLQLNVDRLGGSLPGAAYLFVRDDDVNQIQASSPALGLNDGEWHTLTVVYDPAPSATFWVDGVSYAAASTFSEGSPTFFSVFGYDLALAAVNLRNVFVEHFSGDVALWAAHAAPSPEEIRALHADPFGPFRPRTRRAIITAPANANIARYR